MSLIQEWFGYKFACVAWGKPYAHPRKFAISWAKPSIWQPYLGGQRLFSQARVNIHDHTSHDGPNCLYPVKTVYMLEATISFHFLT